MLASANFLVPNGTFFVELIVFLGVLFVMARWILPPISKSVTDRAEGIRRSVQRAEFLRGEAAKATAERRRILAEARARARGTVDEAVRAAEDDRRAAQERGHAEHARLIDEGREVIAVERATARRDMRQNLAALIAAAAERVIGTEVDIKRHQAIVDDAIAATERVA